MKPYLVSLASYTPGVERYLRSLANLKDSVEWINVGFNPRFAPDESITDSLSTFQTIETNQPYPGNLHRFDYLPKLDPNRMWIFTDTADVVFQTPIPDLKEGIYVCPEYDTWGNPSSWFTSKIGDYPSIEVRLNGEMIYNMGTWAMPGYKALDMLRFVYANAPMMDSVGWCDQPLYNLWLLTQEYQVHSSLMCCLYDGLSKGEIIKQEKLFVNPQGETYCITHANGGTKRYFSQSSDD